MIAKRYFTFAQELILGVKKNAPLTGSGDGAPECRSAISRAYYAAYHCAVEFLDQIGFETLNNHACHTSVQHVLNQSGDASLQEVSTHLSTLHTERKIADYEMKNTKPERVIQAEAILKLADLAIGKIDTVRADVNKLGSIATAIMTYLKGGGASSVRMKTKKKK